MFSASPVQLRWISRELDQAVLAAYGWPRDISDQDILARLLQLNAERLESIQRVTCVLDTPN